MAYIGMNQDSPYGEYLRKNSRRGFDWRMAAPVAGMAALPALGSILGGGAAASAGSGAAAGSSAGYSSPGVFSSMFGGTAAPAASLSATAPAATTGTLAKMGSIFGSRAFEGGVNAALGLYGMRSQNKANEQARRDLLASQAKELELAQQQMAAEMRNADLDREELRAYHDAMQRLEEKKFAIEEEKARFDRQEYEAREARMAPYRAVSQQALGKMQSILGLA